MQRIDLQEKKCIYAKYFQTQRKLQQEKKLLYLVIQSL